MIADALTRQQWPRPEDAAAASLLKARARLPINAPAERDGGGHGIVRAVELVGLDVVVTIELPDGRVMPEMAGWWKGSSR